MPAHLQALNVFGAKASIFATSISRRSIVGATTEHDDVVSSMMCAEDARAFGTQTFLCNSLLPCPPSKRRPPRI